MAFEGEIKRVAFVSQSNADVFYLGLKEKIRGFGKLYVEIQYQTTIQPDGKAVFSALLIGRER